MKNWKRKNIYGKNYPHLNEGHNYALEVIRGKIVVCDYVRLTCLRYFKDLENPKFYIDKARAERAISICGLFVHIKGKLAGQPIVYEPWQKFIMLNIFGFHWSSSKLRRFTRVYIEVARKNGKSLLLSAIALYMTFFDGEEGAEGYSAGTKEDQAKIVWDTAKAMLQKNPRLAKKMGITCGAKSIFMEKMNASYKPVGSDSKTQDGYNPHFVCLDELHAHKNSGMWDIMESAIGAREEPIIFSITTAGFNLEGICYQIRDEIIQVLKAEIYDDTQFGIIFTLDKEDDFSDPKTWIKANPNLGVSVRPEYLESMVVSAKNNPAKKPNILTKNFNKWVAGGEAYFDMDAYDKCQEDFSFDDFEETEVNLGVDMGQKIDLSCTAYVNWKDIDGIRHYYADVASYIPSETLKRYESGGKQSIYSKFIELGVLEETNGPTIDYEIMESDIIENAKKMDVKEVSYDPFSATHFAQNLEKAGIETCEVKQRVLYLSEPMKEIDKLIREGRFHHNGNPLLRWCFGNTCAKEDKNENVFPFKQNKEKKIDAFVAVLIAFVRILFHEEEESHYEDNDILFL